MTSRTWIVLADATSARVFRSDRGDRGWTLIRELEHPAGRERASRVGSDKPGRVKQSRGYRSALEAPTPFEKKEARKFARLIAAELDQAIASRSFDRLILVAAAPFLGLLRSEMSDRVQRSIAATVERDYLHVDESTARQHLREHLAAQ
jgi:protein required for attachment to host cells